MPRIAEFYGIVIYMYHREHGVPHFHAVYGEHEAVIAIRGLGSSRERCRGGPLRWSEPGAGYVETNWSVTGSWREPGGPCSRSRRCHEEQKE